MPRVLALGVGSTTAKAQLFDECGLPIGPVARRLVPLAADGTADPDGLADQVDGVVDDAAARLDHRPDAVAVTGAWHALAGLGGGGGPPPPPTTWGDTRGAAAAGALAEQVSAPATARRRAPGRF